jgi:hypothetical protein
VRASEGEKLGSHLVVIVRVKILSEPQAVLYRSGSYIRLVFSNQCLGINCKKSDSALSIFQEPLFTGLPTGLRIKRRLQRRVGGL